MPTHVLARRSFTIEDQQQFADLSGDQNPIHIDDLAARRALFGRVVVHGVHCALWALDAACAQSDRIPTRIVAAFNKPVFLHEQVTAISDNSGASIRVAIDDTTLLDLQIEYGEIPIKAEGSSSENTSGSGSARSLTFDQVTDLSGSTSTVASDDAWEQAFPSLSAAIGSANVSNIAALSRLVGMDCPGLNSLFAAFDITLSGDAHNVEWRVTKADARFSLVRMAVSGGVEGTVTALMRPAPVQQASTLQLSNEVNAGEFAGMRALVVGGTRGLGEVTAKLIAAGGGNAVVTWHRGETEAKEVVNDLQTCDKGSYALQLDVSDPAEAIDSLREPPTHVFYFASPRITTRRTSAFDAQQLSTFTDVYVDGFVRVLEALGDHEVVAFYPSTVFVEDHQPDLIEYSAAKAAGEVAAKTWAKSHPGCRVVVERLPKLATDQTAVFGDSPAADATGELLRCIRLARESQS